MSIERNCISKYFHNRLIAIFQAKVSNICCFQHLKHKRLYFVIYEKKSLAVSDIWQDKRIKLRTLDEGKL